MYVPPAGEGVEVVARVHGEVDGGLDVVGGLGRDERDGETRTPFFPLSGGKRKQIPSRSHITSSCAYM